MKRKSASQELNNPFRQRIKTNPSRYIIRGYNPQTYGQEYIKEEDVVRPSNHRYTRERDITNNWTQKSRAGHATYGTCDECFDSGPVLKTCRYCGRGQVYLIFRFGNVELDSIELSERLERDLLFQRADRTCEWTNPAVKYVDVQFLQNAVGHNRDLTEERRSMIFNEVMDMLPPDSRSVANTTRYIIQGYNPDSYGQEYIKEEDVVRPSNHKYTTEIDQLNNWTLKSCAGHATYGTCEECFDSGPVWKKCRHCGQGQVYLIFRFGDVELDSIELSEQLERDILFQRADRTFEWSYPGIKYVDVSFLQKAVGCNRALTEHKRTMIFNQVMGMLPPDNRSRVGSTNM